MLVVEYTKKYPISVISHIDLLRVFHRIIRRMDIRVAYSLGFNPHMRVFFSPPAPLGLETTCEYVVIETEEQVDESFLTRFNDACPMGITATKTWQTEKNPNLAKMIDRAEYHFTGVGVSKIKIDGILNNHDYEIEYLDKTGEMQTQKVGEMIFDISSVDNDSIRAVLAFGNKNLRADRFFKYLCAKNNVDFYSCDLKKTNAYVGEKLATDYISEYSKF